MVKRTIIMSAAMAACAGASAPLRGGDMEEVGEQIEHFPLPGWDGMGQGERRLVDTGDEEVVAYAEVIDASEYPPIVPWDGDEDEEAEQYFEDEGDFVDGNEFIWDMDGLDDREEAYAVPDLDVPEDAEPQVEAVEDADAPLKEYNQPDSMSLINTDLMGEALGDQYDRRENSCGNGKSEVKLICKTDNYGYELSWVFIQRQGQGNKLIARGPRQGTNYADNQVYTGRWCVNNGNFLMQVQDKGQDGMCKNNYGCGYCRVLVNGKNAGQVVNDKNNWKVKNFQFRAQVSDPAFSARIDGTTTNNNAGEWCTKVRRVMKVPQGTCRLANGQRGHRVQIILKADKFGEETTVTVRRSGGNVVLNMPAVVSSNSQQSREDCLPQGKYTVAVNDLDGVCCRYGQGFYKVLVDGNEVIKGGAFQGQEKNNFYAGYDWISSMTERDCEWWWAHDYRRRDWHTRCYTGKLSTSPQNWYCNKTYRHLRWSNELKATAKDYAQRLLSTCDTVGIKHDKTEEGENLAKNKGSGTWGVLRSSEAVTVRFVDKEEFWGWNRNAHLTQAMWRPSQYIGCAESVKDMGGNRMCRFQVCRYARAGNCLMGQYDSGSGNNWMKPMMADESPCPPQCPGGGAANSRGCYA